MRNVTLGLVVLASLGTMFIGCGGEKVTTVDIKKYDSVSIYRNISDQEHKEYLSGYAEMFPASKVVDDPQFSCESIGYLKSEIDDQGTKYCSIDEEGNVISVDEKGDDVKLFDYVSYSKEESACTEQVYQKGESMYGDNAVATLDVLP